PRQQVRCPPVPRGLWGFRGLGSPITFAVADIAGRNYPAGSNLLRTLRPHRLEDRDGPRQGPIHRGGILRGAGRRTTKSPGDERGRLQGVGDLIEGGPQTIGIRRGHGALPLRVDQCHYNLFWDIPTWDSTLRLVTKSAFSRKQAQFRKVLV